MLPLGENPAAKDALDAAEKIILKLITPSPGKTEVELSHQMARLKLRELLGSIQYQAQNGASGTIQDLQSSERLDLFIATARSLANGYRQWHQGQVQSILDVWPAQEFYRAEWREKPRNWPEKWKAAGGRFFPGKSNYPEGRMIALKDDSIWETISAFGFPFRPFDFLSGMDIRGVKRSEAVALGLIEPQQRIQVVALPASDEFAGRLETKLRENLFQYEVHLLKQATDC